MSQARLLAPASWDRAFYHCVSRVVDRRFIFGDEEHAEFLHLMRMYEEFCQVKVIILQKDGAKYVLRDGAKSTGGPTADYYKAGSQRIDVKIRLEQDREP